MSVTPFTKNEYLRNGDYLEIPMADSLQLEGFKHAGHCMLYAPWDRTIIGTYKTRAAVLMQIRFDGYIGFPGGAVNTGEDIVAGVNRELEEEINLDTRKFCVKPENHVVSHYSEARKLVTHFYVLEVKYEDFVAIEESCRHAVEYGHETFGITRVPLYTMHNGYGGLPCFLNSSFIGNAKEQLMSALKHTGILTSEEVRGAVKRLQELQRRIYSNWKLNELSQ